MGMNYGAQVSTKKTPQSEAIPGVAQVANDAGGFVFALDDWKRLERSLVLGAEGGTYYASERKLTLDNAAVVRRCIDVDPLRTLKIVRDISVDGRAPKNDPALFALAMICRFASVEGKHAAYEALPDVARIGTHLFHWADYMKHMGGLSGNGAKRAVSRWYNRREATDLAYQVIKYQSRDNWSHKNLLQLAHPESATPFHGAIYDYAVRGWPAVGPDPHDEESLRQIWAFESAKTARGAELIRLIRDYRLPHECVPNDAKDDPATWAAMLPSMGLTALMRNLAKMTAVGLLKPMSQASGQVVERLTDAGELRKAKVHPLQALVALNTYRQGHGVKGKLTWTPVQAVVDALDAAFYAAFQAVEPAGKRTLLALDCSGSMSSPDIAGMAGISPKIGAAAMALVTAATEKTHCFVGFTSGNMSVSRHGGSGLVQLPISPRQRLGDVIRVMDGVPFGGTDCALPMLMAAHEKLEVDTFLVYTDSETWAGEIHPIQALKDYRQKMGIAAKLVVVGMTSSGFTIADPNDAGSMDVVGFDTAAPRVIADFARA